MNFKFLLWKSTLPLEDDQAETIYRSLLRNNDGDGVELSGELGQMAAELEKLYPASSSGSKGDSPWASPVRVETTHLRVAIKPSWLWEVWPTINRLAKKFELVYFDPQQYVVFLPPRLSTQRTRLRAKRKGSCKRPTDPNRAKRLPMSKYPPKLPSRIKIRREKDSYTDTAGVYSAGQQFLGFAFFWGSNQSRSAAVLHRFNADGDHLGSEIWMAKTAAEAEATLAAAVAKLRQVKRRNISIKPFQVQFGKTKFGLVLRKDGKSFEYQPYGLLFRSPWDGTYST